MIPTPVLEYERQHLIAKLDDMSDAARFDLLDAEDQEKIKEEFFSTLDQTDVQEALGQLIEAFLSPNVFKDAKLIPCPSLRTRWKGFLSRELDRYQDRIEAAWIERNR